jgi:hypothetical protein
MNLGRVFSGPNFFLFVVPARAETKKLEGNFLKSIILSELFVIYRNEKHIIVTDNSRINLVTLEVTLRDFIANPFDLNNIK